MGYNDGLPTDKDFMQAHITTLESRITELENELQVLRIEYSDVHDSYTEYKNKCKELEAERDMYLKASIENRNKVSEIEAERDALKIAMKDAINDCFDDLPAIACAILEKAIAKSKEAQNDKERME